VRPAFALLQFTERVSGNGSGNGCANGLASVQPHVRIRGSRTGSMAANAMVLSPLENHKRAGISHMGRLSYSALLPMVHRGYSAGFDSALLAVERDDDWTARDYLAVFL